MPDSGGLGARGRRSESIRAYGRMRSSCERPCSKKQKGHWSADGCGDTGDVGGEVFLVFMSSEAQGWGVTRVGRTNS